MCTYKDGYNCILHFRSFHPNSSASYTVQKLNKCIMEKNLSKIFRDTQISNIYFSSPRQQKTLVSLSFISVLEGLTTPASHFLHRLSKYSQRDKNRKRNWLNCWLTSERISSFWKFSFIALRYSKEYDYCNLYRIF